MIVCFIFLLDVWFDVKIFVCIKFLKECFGGEILFWNLIKWDWKFELFMFVNKVGFENKNLIGFRREREKWRERDFWKEKIFISFELLKFISIMWYYIVIL